MNLAMVVWLEGFGRWEGNIIVDTYIQCGKLGNREELEESLVIKR
jgi:hypothetical protein